MTALDVRPETQIDSSQIDSIREAVALTFTNTCEVLTNTYMSDGAGGRKKVSTVSASYGCKLGIPNWRETEIAQRLTQKTVLALVLPWNAHVSVKQQVRLNSAVYEVIEIVKPDNAVSTRLLIVDYED